MLWHRYLIATFGVTDFPYPSKRLTRESFKGTRDKDRDTHYHFLPSIVTRNVIPRGARHVLLFVNTEVRSSLRSTYFAIILQRLSLLTVSKVFVKSA